MNAKKYTGLVGIVAALSLLLTACGGATGGAESQPDSETVSSGPWSFDVTTSATWDAEAVAGEWTSVDDGEGAGVNMCVLYPHLKDPTWVAQAEALYDEAVRTGISYDLFEAGGYENLALQLSQMEDCISAGTYDVIALHAVSGDGVCSTVEKALDAGIAVIDAINGTLCDEVVTSNPMFHQVAAKYYHLAKALGEYIVAQPGEKKILLLAGPEGVTWSDDSVRGFNDAFAADPENNVIVASPRGDTDATKQLAYASDALTANPEITDIISIAVASSAAMVAVRDAGKEGEINQYSWSPPEDAYLAIPDGIIAAVASDVVPIQERIVVNDAIRLVNGEIDYKAIAAAGLIITADNFADIPRTDVTSSPGAKPVFNYAP
ncbi:substrate-binding domain-containing protein [Leucobacter sp. W1038]|uniref:substrate-binding domain-containing protein n=1 Tax=Leucobacter sp. W1038 TaxID=3438281 RepID=UPI003D961988